MWSRTLWIVFLAYTISILGTNGSNECPFCQTIGNYNTCLKTAKLVECNDALVQMTHLLLLPHNPTLRKDPPVESVGVGYQCFRVNYTVQDVWNYQMGCTYADNRICQGWKLNTQCVSVPAKIVTTTTKVPSSSSSTTVIPVTTTQKPTTTVSTTLIPPRNSTNRTTTVTMVTTTTKIVPIAKNITEPTPKTTQGPVKIIRDLHSDAKAYTIEGEFIAAALAATIWNVFFVQRLW